MIGIHDTLTISPTLLAPLASIGEPVIDRVIVFLRWAQGEGQFTSAIRFWDLAGNHEDLAIVRFQLQDRTKGHNAICALIVKFPTSGVYRFAALLNGKVIEERRLNVRVLPFPQIERDLSQN